VLLSILTPFQLAGLCISGPAAGLLPVLVAERSLRPIWRLDRANRIRLLGAVILGGICGPLALLFGLRMAAASVAMWLNLELVATALLGHFFFRDHLGRYGASFVLYITAAQHIGATRGQIFFSSAPFWGVGLAVLLLGEPFSALQLIAAVWLIVALVLLTSEGHNTQPRACGK
jgi:drug/metabolite transporter (DMT)-like permease